MNDIELMVSGEFRLHMRLPFGLLELLDYLDQNRPMVINATDEEERKLLVECCRDGDSITVKVVGRDGEAVEDLSWSCSVDDILSQMDHASTSTIDMINIPDDDLMTSVIVKEENQSVESLMLDSVSVYDGVELVESQEFVQSSEEQPVEEIVFGDDCKVLTYSVNEPHSIIVDPGVNTEGEISDHFYIQINSTDFESFAESNIIVDHMEASCEESVDDKVMPVMECVEDSNGPKIISNVLTFRCSLCNLQNFKEEAAQTHIKQDHPNSDAVLVTEITETAYICSVCSEPCHDHNQWQLHMKSMHSDISDKQEKDVPKIELRTIWCPASWKSQKFTRIPCMICKSQMSQAESYYFHIRECHQSDPLYKAALKHLFQVRGTTRRKRYQMSVQCVKCKEMFNKQSILTHLRVLHSGDPDLNDMIANTKSSIKKLMKSQNSQLSKVNVRCQFCEKEMRSSALKTHLEFHCPALVAVVPDGEIKEEVLQNATKNGLDTLLVRTPRMTVCKQCDKRMTLKSFYHHHRRVHGIGIKNSKTYRCSYCDKPFWDQYLLQNHLLIHTRDRSFVCLLCSRAFINMISYNEHHRKVHERQFMHTCSTCGRGFWKRMDKVRHNCKAQNLSLNQLKNARLMAKAKAVMDRWQGPFYVEVERSEAEKITIGRTSSSSSNQKSSHAKVEKKLVCVVCKKSFQSVRYFQSHFRYSHLQDFDLICDQCGLGFWNVRQMTTHKCEPARRNLNEKKRQILAARALDMLQSLPKPYYYVLGVGEDSSNYPDLVHIDKELSKMKKTPNEEKDPENSELERQSCEESKEEEQDSEDQPSTALDSGRMNTAENVSTERIKPNEVQPGYCLCSICGKELKVKNFYPHMRRVHCDDSHKPITWKVCDQCGYKCQDNYKFRRHCMTHNKDAGIPCELCHHLSYEVMDYNQHFKRRHLGQFNIRCNDCAKGFWKMNALQAHNCYPELKEENLRIQKLKEEEAITKRDSIRQATGINSNLNEENVRQNRKRCSKRKEGRDETFSDSVTTDKQRSKTSRQRSPREEYLEGNDGVEEGSTNLNSKTDEDDSQRERSKFQQFPQEEKNCASEKVPEEVPRKKIKSGKSRTSNSGRLLATSAMTTLCPVTTTTPTCTTDCPSDPLPLQRKDLVDKTSKVQNPDNNVDYSSAILSLEGDSNAKLRKKRRKLENVERSDSSSTPDTLASTHQYATRKKQLPFRALSGKK